MKACERLQLVQRAYLFEGFSIKLDRSMRGINACATVSIFLLGSGMRRTVGAQEKFIGCR